MRSTLQTMRAQAPISSTSGPIPVSPPAAGRDVVCGMSVRPESPHRHTVGGREFLFCSERCRKRFADNPDAYLPGRAAPGTPSEPRGGPSTIPASKPAIYTCPMHPEIRRDRPGFCPICGMALEPAGAGPEDETELRDMSRRFWIAAGLTALVVLLSMGEMLPGHAAWRLLSMRSRAILGLLL